MNVSKWAFPALILLLASCSTSKKTTIAKHATANNNIACAYLSASLTTPHLNWIMEGDTVLVGYNEMRLLPPAYKIYAIDPVQLDSFIVASKNMAELNTIVPMPDPLGCQVFNLHSFETMNPQLKAKHPNAVTLKGTDQGTGQAAFSITFDSNSIQAEANWGDASYKITTLTNKGRQYYIIYTAGNQLTKQKNPATEKLMRPQYDR